MKEMSEDAVRLAVSIRTFFEEGGCWLEHDLAKVLMAVKEGLEQQRPTKTDGNWGDRMCLLSAELERFFKTDPKQSVEPD